MRENEKTPLIIEATIGAVSSVGVTLILPGMTAPTQKSYEVFGNADSLSSGDRVFCFRTSGTWVVLGAPGGNASPPHYGVCGTTANVAAKTVSIPGITKLYEGLGIRVKFTNNQTYNGAPTLNVNSLGAVNIKRVGSTNAARYEWVAGEVLDFVYDGEFWVLVDGGFATTSYYGVTKLTSSATSTSSSTAATPTSINSLVSSMIANVPVYSASATYAVGNLVRYGFQIWKCSTAITTAEAWNAAHWTALDPLLTMIESLAARVSALENR